MGEQQLRATRRQHNHLQKTPTQIPNLTNVTSLSSGYYSDYALKSDGTVWSWGYNGDGQLGDNTTTTRLTPIQIPNLTNIASISSKYYSAYVLKSDGTVWSWGYNSYGQLGDNTTINKSAPTQIPNLANVTSLASGYYSDYALKADGTVWSWGHNTYWQLCDGTTTDKWESIQINGLALESALTAPTELSINNITSSTLTLAWTLQSGGGGNQLQNIQKQSISSHINNTNIHSD